MLVAGALGAAVVLRADQWRLELLVACGVAVLLLAGALLGSTSLVPWPLVVLAGAYAFGLGGGAIDQWSPIVAAGFLVVAELAYWSLELRGRVEDAERINERRAGLVVALGLGTIALGGLIFAATSVPLGTGVVVDLVGVAAAVGAVAVVASLARSRR